MITTIAATYFSQLAVNPLNNQQIYVAAHTVAVIENGAQVPNSDFDGYFSNAQYLAYIVPAGIPGTPTSLTGQVIPNKFLWRSFIYRSTRPVWAIQHGHRVPRSRNLSSLF